MTKPQVLNRKTWKISYRNSPNLKKIIATDNQRVIRKSEKTVESNMCNCTKNSCLLGGKCQMNKRVYQATVKSENDTQRYVGLTSTTFKSRWANHQTLSDII